MSRKEDRLLKKMEDDDREGRGSIRRHGERKSADGGGGEAAPSPL